MDGKQILNLSMDPTENEALAPSVRDYLKELLFLLWEQKESFNGKRPFGNSGWEHDLERVLIMNDVIWGTLDDNGYVEAVDAEAAEDAILSAIASLS